MKSPAHHLSNEIARMLAECGWHAGRDVSAALKLPKDFVIFPTVQRILAEFGNLKCGKRGPGIECARSTLNLDPSLAEGESDRFKPYSQLIGSKLYPLGEGDDGHYFVAVDERGRVFLVMDFLMFVADSFEVALENLLLGRKPRPVDEQGKY